MDRASLTKRLADLHASVAAANGAIAECEYWLAQLPPEEAAEEYPKLAASQTE